MDFFFAACTRLANLALEPLSRLHPMWGLLLASLLSALAIVWLVGKASPQRQVRTLKAKIRGHLLEMWIFRDSNRVVFAAQAKIVAATLKLILSLVPSLVVMTVPMLLLMAQLQAHYGYRPLQPGEHAILRLVFAPNTAPEDVDAVLEAPEGLAVTSPALRVPEEHEVAFRITAKQEGPYLLRVYSAGTEVSKSVVVSASGAIAPSGRALSAVRTSELGLRLLYPVEAAIPAGAISSIHLEYPSRELRLGRVRLHWLWPYLILTTLAVFPIKSLLRVEL